MKILTSDDKKKLRLVSRYLQSVGMSQGVVDFYLDGSSISTFIPLNPRKLGGFSNSYTIPIPEFIYPLLDRLLTEFEDQIDGENREDYNYERFEIVIDSETMSITGIKYWSYYEKGDSDGRTWDMDEDSEVINEIFRHFIGLHSSNQTFTLNYNGSGDSGYIESTFTNGERVPKWVEDWCYEILERLHGGWEINEGSDGSFFFDLENKTIELEHTFNEEVHKEDTIFEENFDK